VLFAARQLGTAPVFAPCSAPQELWYLHQAGHRDSWRMHPSAVQLRADQASLPSILAVAAVVPIAWYRQGPHMMVSRMVLKVAVLLQQLV